MRKLILILTAVLLICAVLPACGKEPSAGQSEPVSYDGFAVEETSGGGTLYLANLCTLTVEKKESDTLINLDFRSDSSLSGSGSDTVVRNPPYFRAYLLPEPERLVIEFEQLSYWDYMRETDASPSDLIQGIFGHSVQQGGQFSLYIQLSGEAAYRIEQDGSCMQLTLRPIVKETAEETPKPDEEETIDVLGGESAPQGEKYFVLANAYGQLCEGKLTCSEEMTPVLAADKTTVMLISEGFSQKGKAQELMDKLLADQPNAVPADWSIITLKSGELPQYDPAMDYMAAYDVEPARIDGQVQAGEVYLPDGLFLALTPDRQASLYSSRTTVHEAGGGTYEYEQLCLRYPDGTSKAYVQYEFQTIESARYSPDGRKLAVLERAGESTHLYVFDVDSRDMLTDLSAVGFGDTISAYCWDSMGGRIFSIGGSGEIVIHQYDFNVPTENKRHTIVDKKGCDESSLGFADGEVYFCESTMEGGAQIYRIKPEGGLRRTYLAGDAFAFSPDGEMLAYSDNKSDITGAQSEKPLFAVRNLLSGETAIVTEEFSVYAFFWSVDGTKLYYFENMRTGNQGEGGDDTEETAQTAADPYPYRLWVYDMLSGQSKMAADLTSTSVAAGQGSGEIYLCYTDPETMGDVVRATYYIKLDD